MLVDFYMACALTFYTIVAFTILFWRTPVLDKVVYEGKAWVLGPHELSKGVGTLSLTYLLQQVIVKVPIELVPELYFWSGGTVDVRISRRRFWGYDRATRITWPNGRCLTFN